MYEELIQRLENAAGGPEGIQMAHDAAAAIAALSRVEAERDGYKRALHQAIETHSVDQRQIERLERYYLEQARGTQGEE